MMCSMLCWRGCSHSAKASQRQEPQAPTPIRSRHPAHFAAPSRPHSSRRSGPGRGHRNRLPGGHRLVGRRGPRRRPPLPPRGRYRRCRLPRWARLDFSLNRALCRRSLARASKRTPDSDECEEDREGRSGGATRGRDQPTWNLSGPPPIEQAPAPPRTVTASSTTSKRSSTGTHQNATRHRSLDRRPPTSAGEASSAVPDANPARSLQDRHLRGNAPATGPQRPGRAARRRHRRAKRRRSPRLGPGAACSTANPRVDQCQVDAESRSRPLPDQRGREPAGSHP